MARGYLEDAPVELWDAIMHVNLRAPFLCMQEAVKSMKTRGGGSIVNIGSVNAYIGEPKLGPYSVSKGGLMTLTRNAASTLNRHRIRVNQINVGWTLTEGEERVKRREGQGGRVAGRGDRHPAVRASAVAARRGASPPPTSRRTTARSSPARSWTSSSIPVGAPPNW